MAGNSSNTIGRGDLSEAEWAILKPLLPAEHGRPGRPAQDNRTVMNGILWILRTGAPWRDLPTCFGKWNSVFVRFRHWTKIGVWDAILEVLTTLGLADHQHHSVDSTTVRAHRCAAGAKGGAERMRSAVRVVATAPKFIYVRMRGVCRSASL